ncbi:hypothetical protein R1sor_017463 [Riccia sorocarpa]|uniref:CCHC-type domain-containing protein n=1 Tax=Riccia sorocarpa TaxID=122646 RepID=A0ABD3I7A1_9MARC
MNDRNQQYPVLHSNQGYNSTVSERTNPVQVPSRGNGSGSELNNAELNAIDQFPTLAESSKTGGKKGASNAGNKGADTAPTAGNAWRNNGRSLFGSHRERSVNQNENPYLEKVDPKWGKDITDAELWQIFRITGRTQADPDLTNTKILPWTDEDTKLLKVRKDQLCESAVVLHLPNHFPMRDELETWIEVDLGRKFQIRMLQLKLVGKQNWLLVLENREHRDRLLNNAPLIWGRVTVEVSPWTTEFNPMREFAKRVATWVEIPLADALLEPLGDKFLQALGKPTFKTMNRGVCRYPNIWGCVMVKPDADLPEKLALQLPDGSVIIQEVKYQGAPNTCFRCKQTGHEARNCANGGKLPTVVNRNGPRMIPVGSVNPEILAASRPKVNTEKDATPKPLTEGKQNKELSTGMPPASSLPPQPAVANVPSNTAHHSADLGDFLQVQSRNKIGKSQAVENRSSSGRVSPLIQRASVDLGANPFHVLAGAFEVEMEETSNQLEVTTGPTKNGELETPRNDKHLEEESETDVEEEIDAVSTHNKEKLANNVKSHEETLEFLMREAQKLQAEAQIMLGESSTSPAEDSETGTQESEETQGANLETLAPILQLEPTPPIKLVKADWSEEPEDDDEVSLKPCDQNEQSRMHEQDSDLSLDVLKGEKAKDTSHTNVAEFEGEREEGNGQLARYSASLAEWQNRPSTYDNIVFNASKQPSQLAIGDSQTKSGTWRRIDIGRRTQILADTEVEGEGKAGSEAGDDFSEEDNTQLSSPSTSGARGKPPDNQGIEGVSKGACLNLQKSIIMQLKPQHQPDWMESTGCEIAGPGRSFKYLGIATSSPINEKIITEEIVQKLMKKLKHWSNRLLSWPAKTILLKHVLAATPLYQLMSIGLCKDGLEELERLCRNFLWGSWYRARKHLRWNNEGGELAGAMSMLQVKAVHQIAAGTGVGSLPTGRELGILRRIGIGTFEQAIAASNRGGWKECLRRQGIFPEEGTMGNLETLESWCRAHRLVRKNLLDLNGWKWDAERSPFQWQRPTQNWRQTLAKEVDFSQLMDERWQNQSQQLTWAGRWKLLWAAPVPYRRKENSGTKAATSIVYVFRRTSSSSAGMD